MGQSCKGHWGQRGGMRGHERQCFCSVPFYRHIWRMSRGGGVHLIMMMAGGGAWQLQPAAERGQEMLQWRCSQSHVTTHCCRDQAAGIPSLSRYRGGFCLMDFCNFQEFCSADISFSQSSPFQTQLHIVNDYIDNRH